MNYRFGSFAAMAAISLAGLASTPALPAKTDLDNVCVSVGRLLEEGHYTHKQLNDDLSGKILRSYLELLDFSHLFFTQEDVNAITEKYGASLDDDILLGNLKPAYEIYDLYQKRVDERVAKVKEFLKQQVDFKTDGTIDFRREKSPWPKNGAEADELWRGRITSELLQEHLSEHPIEPGPQLVARRYDRLARNVHESDRDEQAKFFLDAVALAYDPHSEYLSESDLKNFSINMGLSLVGIGAMLRTEDGYAKIESLVPGGPAQVDGRLKVGDRITAVGQGTGDFVDVRDMRLDKVVEMIRGKKGSRVRLLVIPADAADPSKRKNVELVRDEIKLKDQEARADIIIKKDQEGRPVKLGWITLPSFYADMDHHAKSTTKDVMALLKRLKKENIAGLVVDLRRNGGGSHKDGALKLTIQKFYRVAGGSTQLHGVASDIVLPSLTDLPEFAEGALKNCLPYDEVPKAKYTKWNEPVSLYIDELRRRSSERAQNDPEFHYVMEDQERLRHRLDDNRISLNEDVRKKELSEDKLRKEMRSKERLARNIEEPRVYRVTLDTVDKPNLQLIMYPGKLAQARKAGSAKVAPEAAGDSDTENDVLGGQDDDTKEPAIDPERDETVNILSDLIRLERGPKTASTNH